MYLQQLGTRAKNGYRPSTSAQSFFCPAPFYPNSYAAPVPFHAANTGFHAAKGYGSPQYTGNFYNNYAHPVNAQYWTGHSLPGGYQNYPQQYGYQQGVYGGYMQYGQPYGAAGYQSWNYPSPYNYWGVHPAYSAQYAHYPNFNANYWTGHHGMYAPVYPHHVPYYGHAQYPYYRQPYYYGRRKPFLQSGLAKGLLGALAVGVIVGKVARGK